MSRNGPTREGEKDLVSTHLILYNENMGSLSMGFRLMNGPEQPLIYLRSEMISI